MMRNSRFFMRAGCVIVLWGAALFGQCSTTASADNTISGSFILAKNNQIARVLDSSGGLTTAAQTVSGIAIGEQLQAIAIRPLNNRLYGLAATSEGAVRLYHIDSGSGAPIATPLNDTPLQFSNGVNPVPIGDSTFDINFNPSADRIRVVGSNGTNFRMNPNTGAILDGDAVTPGINPDSTLNGGATTASAVAYTNSFVNATATTLYTIDAASNTLYIQNPPNNGTLTNGVAVTLGGAPLDFDNASLDIPASVVVNAASAPANGQAYAALTIGNDQSLYTIDLANGAATRVASLNTFDVLDLALAPTVPVGVVLSGDGTTLDRFRLDQPGTTTSVAVSGVQAGDVLVGIDGRPATGQTFSLGVNTVTNSANLYLIDPQTGAATAVGSGIAFVDSGGNTVDLPDPSIGYGFDFNPSVDRIRVVVGSGLNFRINPNTGVPVDGNAAITGTNPDNPIGGAANGATAAAYANSFSGATITTLYTLDSTNDTLLIQNPPNNGTQTNPIGLTLNGAPLDFTTVNGFDIPTAVTTSSANAPVASGSGYVALSIGGITSLYRLNLVSGEATLVGGIGTGTANAEGLVVWTPTNAPTVFTRFAPLIGTATK